MADSCVRSKEEIMVTIIVEDIGGLGIPKYATDGASGFDLKANVEQDVVIAPGTSVLIPTGLKMEIPKGYEVQIRPRSGLARKNMVTVLNTPGTIDNDYRGELGVILINHGMKDFVVTRGMRIAQGVIQSVIKGIMVEGTVADNTERGSGGFGSTGLK